MLTDKRYRNEGLVVSLSVLMLIFLPPAAFAWHDPGLNGSYDAPNSMVVIDGSYVMDIGQLQMNITNNGLIGSQYSIVSTYSDAPSGQWPGGSGIEYLFGAGLWVGGILNGAAHVSTGQFEREFWPLKGPEHTIYEARYAQVVRPFASLERHGARIFEAKGDDDGDGRYNEETLNGLDDDGDLLIDEDFEMYGNQMMVCTMYDNTPISMEMYPDHVPLNLEVVQTAFAWELDDVDDFVTIRYRIRNVGKEAIESVHVGMLVDCDIGPRDAGGSGAFNDLAGRFQGMARADNGMYEDVDVAYMYDGQSRDHVDGYFGVMFRGPGSWRHGISSFNIYSGIKPYELGGVPTNDAERYNELSKRQYDANTTDDAEGDYHFLVSNGNVGTLLPGGSTLVEVVFICGNSLEELLVNCANAHQTWEGAWYDLDGDPYTGVNGLETHMCIEYFDLTMDEFRLSPFPQMVAMAVDESCRPKLPISHNIRPEDLVEEDNGYHCIWVNMDNCDECENLYGRPCGKSQFWKVWNCSKSWLSQDERRGCTGILGRESVVRWITESVPPPPPMRLWSESGVVHIVWNNDSEGDRDLITTYQDFEGYRVYRAENWDRPFGTNLDTGPAENDWRLIAHYDLVNDAIVSRDLGFDIQLDTIPLGFNTGLDVIEHRPACLDDPLFEGLAGRMREALATGLYTHRHYRPTLRLIDGSVREGLTGLLPWEAYPAELDTFYWLAEYDGSALGGEHKTPKVFYEYIDREIHNGFLYFYGVVTTDHAMATIDSQLRLTGAGIVGDPTTNFAWIRPGSNARTANEVALEGDRIFVYPNPATMESLAEFQKMHPNSDDPTGMRVMFTNLPAFRNTIRIFTLDGDLVAEIDHDGTGGYGDASWNLVTRNGQQAVSGIYLYMVHSDNDRISDFIDKFVLIR